MAQTKTLSSYHPLTVGAIQNEFLKNPKAFGSVVKNMATFQNQWEIIFQPKYDRVEYAAAGVATLQFFSKPQGASDTLITGGASGSRVKNLRDTNARQANQQSDEAFIMMGVQLGYIPLSTGVDSTSLLNFEDDKAKIATGSYFQMILINKPYIQTPAIFIPSPFESKGAKALAMYDQGAATINVIGGPGGYGDGKITSSYPCDPPYLIEPGEGYTITLNTDSTALSSGNDMDIICCLVGYTIRPVQ